VAHEVVLTETVVETLEQFETEDAERIINKLEDIGDFRFLIDWDKDNETLYAIDAFERKKEYRELGKYREVWGYQAISRVRRRIHEEVVEEVALLREHHPELLEELQEVVCEDE
jgi:mRNA interferase RelE/StbE